MAEVIDLERRKSAERRRRKARARRMAQAVASALSCGMCPRRCAHCGLPIDEPGLIPGDAPYPMCSPCLAEYRAYRRREQGDTTREAYWHTEQWENMWRTWLEAMQAGEEFRRSPEFLRLMQEHLDED